MAEEALRGVYLVEGRHFEVLNFSVGNSAETLYLYLVGAMTQIFGPTTLAIQLVGWPFGLGTVCLTWKLLERLRPDLPSWLGLLTAASSLWRFHYARNGLRAISAPFFLAAFALLLDRAEHRPSDRKAALLAGAVLGLSLYGYTSARALPIAFLAYAAWRLAQCAGSRPELLRRYAALLTGAMATSIPNLLFLLRHPKEFLSRGDYVMIGNAGDYVTHLIWSILLPLYYSDHYRHIQIDRYRSDGVAAGFTSAGHNPLPFMFAIALTLGVWQIRRHISQPLAAFLIVSWAVAALSLGVAGPSPTRFLILLPVYLTFAALGFGWVIEKWPKSRAPVLALMVFAGALEGYGYLSGPGESTDYRMCYDPGPVGVGERADALAAAGQRVLCVLSRDSNVVNYLTHRHSRNVKIVEFFARPFDPSKIPIAEFPPDVLLVQDDNKFCAFAARLPAGWRAGYDQRFVEFHLPPR